MYITNGGTMIILLYNKQMYETMLNYMIKENCQDIVCLDGREWSRKTVEAILRTNYGYPSIGEVS